MDVRFHTTEELKALHDEISEEILKRERAAQDGEWNTVRQAIKNYCNKYGAIQVCTPNAEEIFNLDEHNLGGLPSSILLY